MTPGKTVIYDLDYNLACALRDKLKKKLELDVRVTATDSRDLLIERIQRNNLALVVLDMDADNRGLAEVAKGKGTYVCGTFQTRSRIQMEIWKGHRTIIDEYCTKEQIEKKIVGIAKRAYQSPQ